MEVECQVPNCRCGIPANLVTAWTEENPGRRFFVLQCIVACWSSDFKIATPFHCLESSSVDFASPTILFFQENAGNIAHRLEMVRIMLQRLQCNVFMLSYRGYGASDGYPSQHGIINDAQAALDHLSQGTDIDTNRIVVFGRSLGGAVGAVLTKNNPEVYSL